MSGLPNQTQSITISTHVLDTALGKPAAGIPVQLVRVEPRGETTSLASGVTNADGRVASLVPPNEPLVAGNYRLRFGVGPYFASANREAFYAEVNVDFRVSDAPQHYHVPLLVSPFGYSTYRGS